MRKRENEKEREREREIKREWEKEKGEKESIVVACINTTSVYHGWAWLLEVKIKKKLFLTQAFLLMFAFCPNILIQILTLSFFRKNDPEMKERKLQTLF
jgi:hypothetical protein